MKRLFYFLIFIVLLWMAYLVWSSQERIHSSEQIFPRYVIGNYENYGINTGKGNVIALSPYLHTYDFSSKEAFYNMLHYYLSFAQRKKILNDSTIVVLPEYIGTWLVIANEKQSVFKDTAISDAMQTIVLSNIGKFGKAYIQSTSSDKTKEAVFRMKAEKMAEIYETAFSKLAREFHVSIVAGSIVLPGPEVREGHLKINRKAELYNVSAVFDKNGNIISALTKKKCLIAEEQIFTAKGDEKNQPVYKTPAGNLAVLICADAWYPDQYKKLKAEHADILAVPSYVSGNDAWKQKWKGYNGGVLPEDVDSQDIGYLTEREAWLKYSMSNRAASANIKTAVSVFLRGDFWNLGSDGHPLIWHSTSIETKEVKDKTGTLINVWL